MSLASSHCAPADQPSRVAPEPAPALACTFRRVLRPLPECGIRSVRFAKEFPQARNRTPPGASLATFPLGDVCLINPKGSPQRRLGEPLAFTSHPEPGTKASRRFVRAVAQEVHEPGNELSLRSRPTRLPGAHRVRDYSNPAGHLTLEKPEVQPVLSQMVAEAAKLGRVQRTFRLGNSE